MKKFNDYLNEGGGYIQGNSFLGDSSLTDHKLWKQVEELTPIFMAQDLTTRITINPEKNRICIQYRKLSNMTDKMYLFLLNFIYKEGKKIKSFTNSLEDGEFDLQY